MPHALSDTTEVDQSPGDFLAAVVKVFKVFGSQTQDSGNISYGVEIDDRRFFVKTTDPDAEVLLDFGERVGLLRNAVRIARICSNPVLPSLLNVIECPAGPMLIYEWADGELLYDGSARQRFRRLPVDEVLLALDRIFELHVELADAGCIAVDFYDGCLIYDFTRRALHVVDLDGYHQGPFRNSMGRMFGSGRFMAPEEFEYGQLIDERTTVFTMGRAAAELLSDGSLDRRPFRSSHELREVVIQACRPLPQDRFESVRRFHDAWRKAR